MSRPSRIEQVLAVLWLAFLLFAAFPGVTAAVAWLLVLKKIGLLRYDGMEHQCVQLLAALRSASVALDVKLDLLTKLKTHIKHHHVADPAINPAFEVIRYAISHSQFLDAGFSILSHLTKRLELQEQLPLTAAQGKKTYPIVLERLGDAKDRVRLRAIQALTELWKASRIDVEQLVRDSALAGKSPRAKEAAMQWIIKMNMEYSLQFKSFVAKLIDCLQDADGAVRDTAKSTIVELFLPASEAAKSDLKKQLEIQKVRKTIVTHIYKQLGLSIPQEVEVASSTHTHEGEASSTLKTLETSISKSLSATTPLDEPMPTPANSQAEMEAYKLDPLYVSSSRELDEMVRSMLPVFEGKEVEDNWIPREKNIIKLRRITKGNAPLAYNTTYILSIKLILDGILKTVNSLRTTVSTNGCHLIQDVARAGGSGLDSMVEILLQSLIKLCGGTKTISAQNGNETVDALFANVTYNVRLMQHIWVACQDKNIRPRSYATGWLKTLITKHGHHRAILEHANGLDIIDKCIKKGLADTNPGVRESMRATYWAYWLVWSDRADMIMQSLDPKQQSLLLKDSSNPGSSRVLADPAVVAVPKAPVLGRPAATASRGPSLKETIAARKKEARLVERPESAQSSVSPVRPVLPRPATSMAIGSLSSAPLRPNRTKLPAKKVNSPAVSPLKSKPRAAIPELAASQREPDRPRSSPPSKPAQQQLENLLPRKPTLGKTTNGIGNEIAQAKQSPSPTYTSIDFKPEAPQTELPPKRVIVYSDSTNLPAATLTDPEIESPSECETFRTVLTELHVNHEAGSLPLSSPECESTDLRLIKSGIARVKTRTLDAHGYRKLNHLLLQRPDLWIADNCSPGRVGDLIVGLIDHLRVTNPGPLQAQIMKTLRLTMTKYQFKARYHVARAVETVIDVIGHYLPQSHLAEELEKIAKDMVRLMDDRDQIVSSMEYLTDFLEKDTEAAPASIAMALKMLCRMMIMGSLVVRKGKCELNYEEQARLAKVLLDLMRSDHTAIRRHSSECLMELYDMAGSPEAFWPLLGTVSEANRSLIHYFIAVHEGEVSADEDEDE